MTADDRENSHSRLDQPGAVADCIDQLMAPGGASLLLARPGSTPLPVVVREARANEWLRLDIDSVEEVWGDLKQGARFHLLGRDQGDALRSSELALVSMREEDGRMYGYAPYPVFFDVMRRRGTYRAELRLGMAAFGTLATADGVRVTGVLRNLSLGGCQLRLPLTAVKLLGSGGQSLLLTLSFPDGTELALEAVPRHDWADPERGEVLAGFHFERTTPQQERQLWVLVREIEREAARYRHQGQGSVQPSPLFRPPRGQSHGNPGGAVPHYHATPMTRRLARIADYLEAQVLALRRGERVDSAHLSLSADRLLALLDEDREEVLFAVVSLDREPLIAHCLAVAVRLVDLTGRQRLSPQLRKALAASALIHDLGRVLLPGGLLAVPSLAELEPADNHPHVTALLARLGDCRWLSSAVINAVVSGSNERLDGSGYPQGLAGEQLHGLSRMVAIIDAVDCLSRRAGGERLAIDGIVDYLDERASLYDRRWLRLYCRHFGELPVGTLVSFDGGQLAWVRHLDAERAPLRMQLASTAARPGPGNLGAWIEGETLASLGRARPMAQGT